MLQGKHVFITGGAGFIGSNLAKRLIGNNTVALFDNFSRNAAQHILGRELADKNGSRLKVYEASVLDQSVLCAAIDDFQPTHIVHCAAVAGIDTVVKKPVDTLEINMLGTVNLLHAAYQSGKSVERVVTFSTSEIFGPQAYNSNERSSAVIGAVGEARWTYAVSKLASEHLTLAYHNQHGIPTVVLRPFNVYGPGQVGEGALSIFIQRALRDQRAEHGFAPQVRIGLHRAEATFEDANYSGSGVHLAARIGAVADGGQIVVSRSTASSLGGNLPLSPAESVALKGFTEPVEVVRVDWQRATG